MKSTKVIISLFMVVGLMFGCQQPAEKEVTKTTEESIAELESSLFDSESNTLDRKKANELSYLYEKWAHENKENVEAPSYLLKAADISMNLNNPRRSIGLFDQILKNYPQSKQASSSAFLKAFVYDDQLKDYVNAGKYYTEFIEKYPESPFINDAEASLKNLGKSPEELVKEFEKNQSN
jgi:outer membrane protein assembly factor BamD (BamD/ComL family)